MDFPHIKGKLTLLEKTSKVKKVSKVVHFTDFFLRAFNVYSHFEFELKKYYYHMYGI